VLCFEWCCMCSLLNGAVLYGTVCALCWMVLYVLSVKWCCAVWYCMCSLLSGAVCALCWMVLYVLSVEWCCVVWCCMCSLLSGAVCVLCWMLLYVLFVETTWYMSDVTFTNVVMFFSVVDGTTRYMSDKRQMHVGTCRCARVWNKNTWCR